MTQEQYTYWLTMLMLVNIPSQIFLAHLFFRWRVFTRRPWVKRAFAVAGVLTMGVVVLRIVSFTLPDDHFVRFAPFIVGTILNLTVTTMFWLATRVMGRRLFGKGIDLEAEDCKTSDLVGTLIFELKQGTEGKLR